jgi:WD40 repeat protein
LAAETTPGIQPLLYKASGAVFSLAWSPDGTRIVTASDANAQIWDATTGKTLRMYPQQLHHLSMKLLCSLPAQPEASALCK